MAVNLTETAIRALKAKKTSFYVWSNSSQRGTGRLGVKVQSSGSKIFYFRYYVEKGKKERFIQLGIWPEMKLATANELAKSMVPGSLKERIPGRTGTTTVCRTAADTTPSITGLI